MGWDTWISIYKIIDLYPYLATHTKIHSKWVTDLSVNAKTIKLLKENVEKMCGYWVGEFLTYNNKHTIHERTN